MTTSTIKAAVIQQAIPSSNKADNLNATAHHVRQAASTGAELVLLQELHGTQYFCQTQSPELFDLAEPIDGKSRQCLETLAAELNIVIVGSILRKEPLVFTIILHWFLTKTRGLLGCTVKCTYQMTLASVKNTISHRAILSKMAIRSKMAKTHLHQSKQVLVVSVF